MTRWLTNGRRSTTDDLRRFSVHQIARHGLKVAGARFIWRWPRDGEPVASIGARVKGDAESAELLLEYKLNGEPIAQRIRLLSSPCQFGGARWFGICPSTGRRVAHLYIGPSGALSRHAYRLAFDSSRECAVDRSLRRRNKALAKLKSDDPQLPLKPKGMHWHTYERTVEAVYNEVETFDRLMLARFGANF